MRILVLGGGGREHAIVWKLVQSPLVKKIFVAPGNPGIAGVAECLPISTDKTVELADFARDSKIDLTVVGPEAPLVHGIVDYFRSRGLVIFGPTKDAARLEGSKVFAKEFMQRHKVPTARFQVFDNLEGALKFVKMTSAPLVVKADGLAGGKGAVVAKNEEEAIAAVNSMMRARLFGEAGSRILIEECLVGEEVSVLALVDGTNFIPLSPSQDHKRAFENDEGPNTGGMGAYSPVPMLEPGLLEEISRTILEPVVRGMEKEGTPFVGILYAGLMLTASGPKVLEFNVRFGDPETQAILPRMKSDLTQLMLAAVEGKLGSASCDWDKRSAACVVLASGGYPEKYDVGRPILGLERVADLPETLLFQAGTKLEKGKLLTWGGRVLNVVGLGDSLEAALERAYQAVEVVHFEGKQFRRDIGARALRHKAFMS